MASEEPAHTMKAADGVGVMPWEASMEEFLPPRGQLGAALSGAVGGPIVVGLLTPQRNAMTLAAKETSLSYFGLYSQVFKDGFSSGFRGGSRPVLAAMPQFTAIGPVYLFAEKTTGSSGMSMFCASIVESLFTFAPQSRNAQIQYNATRSLEADKLQLHPANRLAGAGFSCHVGRNFFAMMGIRIFSPHSLEVVKQIPGTGQLGEEGIVVASDLLSSIISATLSMPFNHIFSWSACTPALDSMSYTQRARESVSFLVNNYMEQGLRLLARDLAVRISYTGLLFTGYRYVERKMVNV
mmetsp:Transcript_6949/g.18776  ORF Transcript_6949/g.18776 Transcript_6949/m.18776 type:complete len:296 (+) Transcript_6949:3-890(+)